MKNILRAVIIAIIPLIILMGCSKSFLDTNDPSLVNIEGYYKDSVSLGSALTGAYRGLQNVYNTGMYLIGDVATDNSYSIATTDPNWDPLDILSNDGNVKSIWTAHYLTIGRANSVIKFAEGVAMPESSKSVIVGEAKFLRALCYFNMVRIWGKVPLVLMPFEQPEDAFTTVEGRAEVSAVYDQIIQDVSDAYNVLPDYYPQNNPNAGRATKAAAISLWGQVLLTQDKNDLAVQKFSELVSNESKYNVSLLPKSQYADIFSTSNEMNKEIIFAVRYAAGFTPAIGSRFANQFFPIPAKTLVNGTTYSGNLVHPDLRDAFEDGDIRKSASIDSVADANGVYFLYTKKYLNPGGTKVNDQNNDWIVFRYADVLLLYAEALNNNGQSSLANDIVTRVRERAGLAPLTVSGQSDLKKKILQERRVELNMEGHRWFDLVRQHEMIPVLTAYFQKYKIRSNGTGPEPFRVLFPIPFDEIQSLPKLAPNNEGY